ncbi:MAG: hypothetical protein GY903_21040 [Fuerstiella sp.]|nr:hypothetical protein [Fuerstiella sp.]MCP4856976.1 hypothetical protein [Fuerstiella sp.]
MKTSTKYFLVGTLILLVVWVIVLQVDFSDHGQQSRSRAYRLRNLAVAMHNYASSNGGLIPNTVRSESGVNLVSWRFCLVPWLDSAKMEFEVFPDLPWTADVYRDWRDYRQSNLCVEGSTDTRFAAVTGEATVWSTSLTLPEMPGDLLILTEVSRGSHWMDPNDVDIDATDAQTIGELTGLQHEVHVAFADASVMRLKSDTPLSVLSPFFSVVSSETSNRVDLEKYSIPIE